MATSWIRCRFYFLHLSIVFGITPVLELSPAQAQGGPPLLTDDPGTPGNRHWEVNLAVTVEHIADASLYEAPLVDANYGLGERIQLKLEMPFLIESGSGARTGLGNPSLGVKWRFVDDSSSGLAISTFPSFEFPNPILPLDESENESTLLLPIELTIPWRGLGVNGEIGYRIGEGGDNEVIYGLALGHAVTQTLELLSECRGSSARLRGSELICQVGARKAVGEHYGLMGALGRAVAGHSEKRVELQMYLGVQLRW
ncbi:MAG: hypothetical protein ACJ8AV_10270 [Gemmatimonadales bacterium]